MERVNSMASGYNFDPGTNGPDGAGAASPTPPPQQLSTEDQQAMLEMEEEQPQSGEARLQGAITQIQIFEDNDNRHNERFNQLVLTTQPDPQRTEADRELQAQERAGEEYRNSTVGTSTASPERKTVTGLEGHSPWSLPGRSM